MQLAIYERLLRWERQGLEEKRPPAADPAPSVPQLPFPQAPEAVRMLGGRMPDSISREFQYTKLEAESLTGLRRGTTKEDLEVLVRLLRDEDFKARWMDAVTDVRQGRRGR